MSDSLVRGVVRLRARRRGEKGRRRRYGWLGLAAVAILLGVAFWLLRSRLPAGFGPHPEEPAAAEQAPIAAYELYFGAPDASGLQREIRYLPRTGALEEDARAVIGALVEGSLAGGISPWPRETTLEDLFVSTSGIAYVDFNGSLREYAPQGDYIEWLLAASLTRALCANFPALRGVRILIDTESTGPLLRTIPLEWTLTAPMFTEAS
jgi:hypothetical protein